MYITPEYERFIIILFLKYETNMYIYINIQGLFCFNKITNISYKNNITYNIIKSYDIFNFDK